MSVVRPIPKVLAPSSVSDFRPISLHPIVSKIFEGIMFRELSKFFEQSNYFTLNQFGFRSRFNTEVAVLDLVENVRMAIDRHLVTIVVLIDFSVAFNSLYTSYIVSTLLAGGVAKETAKWIAECFTGRQFAVIKQDGELTGWYGYVRGFGQGSRGG